MSSLFHKSILLVYPALFAALILSLFFWPNATSWIGISLLMISAGSATFFSFQGHWYAYQQAECTREKMTRNLSIDLLGLLLTMGAAMSVGRLAGGYFGMHAGVWVGLLAGFAGGFLAAWAVRSAWGRLVLST